jgi:hypothetical protein
MKVYPYYMLVDEVLKKYIDNYKRMQRFEMATNVTISEEVLGYHRGMDRAFEYILLHSGYTNAQLEDYKKEAKLDVQKEFVQEEYKAVSLNYMKKIIDTREPLGKFYALDKAKDKYIGIDNQRGDVWTEEFDTKKDCFDWLNGKELETGWNMEL